MIKTVVLQEKDGQVLRRGVCLYIPTSWDTKVAEAKLEHGEKHEWLCYHDVGGGCDVQGLGSMPGRWRR